MSLFPLPNMPQCSLSPPFEIFSPLYLLFAFVNDVAYHYVSYLTFFFGMSAEKQHKLFSSCHRPKYTLYSPQLSDLLMRIYVPSGVSHRRIVMPSGEKLLVLWLAATQWGIKRLPGFIVFVLPKRLQNKDIKTVWTDTLKLLLVLLYNCISDIDYSFLKMSSKA